MLSAVRGSIRLIGRQSPEPSLPGPLMAATFVMKLKVSKNSFDFVWINAIETIGRPDWYEPLRRRSKTEN